MKYFYTTIIIILTVLHMGLVFNIVDVLKETSNILKHGVVVQKMEYTNGIVIKPNF